MQSVRNQLVPFDVAAEKKKKRREKWKASGLLLVNFSRGVRVFSLFGNTVPPRRDRHAIAHISTRAARKLAVYKKK